MEFTAALEFKISSQLTYRVEEKQRRFFVPKTIKNGLEEIISYLKNFILNVYGNLLTVQ